jgi:hypothetical protein
VASRAGELSIPFALGPANLRVGAPKQRAADDVTAISARPEEGEPEHPNSNPTRFYPTNLKIGTLEPPVQPRLPALRSVN